MNFDELLEGDEGSDSQKTNGRRRFIPGIRMYQGKKTLFWNREKLWDEDNGHSLVYDKKERETWEVIIILPGVELLPERAFNKCKNLKTIIMADTVRVIHFGAFEYCRRLDFMKLSSNLEGIRD